MSAGRRRLIGLDVFRGATVAAMIVVNNPGNWHSVFRPFMHAAWHGVTAADLIFPAFVFIMGVTMSITLAVGHGRTRTASYRRIAMRGLLLVLLGVTLNVAVAWPHPYAARIPGVLQRLGVVYIVAAPIVLNTTRTQQSLIILVLLLGHWGLLWSGGTLEPDGNLGATVDRMLFGSHTLTAAGDPEGALGVPGAVVTALCGAIVASWLLPARDTPSDVEAPARPVGRIAVAGAACVLLGYLWSTVLPLNKALWTPSFALLSAGTATLGLVLCVMWAPRRSRAVEPLLWLGTNPLAIYFLSELLTTIVQRPWLTFDGHDVALKDLLYWDVLVPAIRDGGGPWSSLAYATLYALIWIGVAGVMQWKRVRFTV
jgi:predicted acyltransferase